MKLQELHENMSNEKMLDIMHENADIMFARLSRAYDSIGKIIAVVQNTIDKIDDIEIKKELIQAVIDIKLRENE